MRRSGGSSLRSRSGPFMRVYPNLDFREEFGISYLDPDETPQTRINPECDAGKVEDGFIRIDTGMENEMPF